MTDRDRWAPPPDARSLDLDLLLEAAAQGEEGAFDLVCAQLSAPLYSVIRAVLRDPAQAEEVTQEVLLEIWQLAFRYDSSKGSAAGWALTIARRRAIDRVRSAAAAAGRDRQIAAALSLDQVSVTVEDSFDRDRLRRCLGGLSGLQRQAILLAFYGGHTYPEVASMLGVPLSTAKARIWDGLIKLRDCMQNGLPLPAGPSPRPNSP